MRKCSSMLDDYDLPDLQPLNRSISVGLGSTMSSHQFFNLRSSSGSDLHDWIQVREGTEDRKSTAPRKTPTVSRNPDLIRGVGKYSPSKMYHKRGLWAIKAKNGGVFLTHAKKPAEAVAAVKPPKFYPADDVKKPLINKRKAKPTKLRASITPGTVLIILAGRFKGKRVVLLKQLTSGLLFGQHNLYLKDTIVDEFSVIV